MPVIWPSHEKICRFFADCCVVSAAANSFRRSRSRPESIGNLLFQADGGKHYQVCSERHRDVYRKPVACAGYGYQQGRTANTQVWRNLGTRDRLHRLREDRRQRVRRLIDLNAGPHNRHKPTVLAAGGVIGYNRLPGA